MHFDKRSVKFLIGFLLFSILFARVIAVRSQGSAEAWSAPLLVYEGDGWTQYNHLFGSPDGRLHSFFQSDPSQRREGEQSLPGSDNLWYSQIQNNSLTAQVNILVPPPDGGRQVGIRAVLDPWGTAHLFSFSKIDCLQHNYAPLSSMVFPIEWMNNQNCVGETNTRFGVAMDAEGQIHIAYANPAGRVLYNRYDPSIDRWFAPITVFVGKDDFLTTDVRIAIDERGRLHVVWSEYEAPEFYPPKGIFYSRSTDNGLNWSDPYGLAGLGHVEPEIITIGEDQIHVAWNGSAVINDRYHTYSNDGGETWSSTHVFTIPGGILGPPALAGDSSNTVHAVMDSDHGLFYANWAEGSGWSDLEQIWPDVQTGDPAAIVTDGNLLHVMFREGIHAIYYMTRIINAPYVAPQPTFTPLPTETPDPLLQLTDTPTPLPPTPTPTTVPPEVMATALSGAPPYQSESNPMIPIGVSAAPVFILIMVVLVVKSRRG